MITIDDIKSGNVDEVDLLECITSNDVFIALAVAESPLATAPILAIAAMDMDERIRMAALKNANISDKTICLLCNDEQSDIAEMAREEAKRRNL